MTVPKLSLHAIDALGDSLLALALGAILGGSFEISTEL
jgi:hypothetical protein